jgi:hypothetical protein
MINDHELIGGRLDVLYVRDGHGRLLHDNEPFTPSSAPLVHVSAGRDLTVCATRQDVPVSVGGQLMKLANSHADPCNRPSSGFIDRLQAALESYFAVGALYAGPAYRFPDNLPSHTEAVLLCPPMALSLKDDWGDIAAELIGNQPCTASMVDGRAVAVCQTVRRSATMAEAGLDTLPSFRRQRHGTKALLHWVQEIRASGLEPLYSTSWDNTASNGLANSLRLSQYGTDLNIREHQGES